MPAPTTLTHVPSLRQGELAQLLTSVAQLEPVKPAAHAQVYPLPLPLGEHVPPFWHGLGEHGVAVGVAVVGAAVGGSVAGAVGGGDVAQDARV